MSRGYEHVQRAQSFRTQKLPCDPALASAALCVEIASDIDKTLGPSEAVLFGTGNAMPLNVLFSKLDAQVFVL